MTKEKRVLDMSKIDMDTTENYYVIGSKSGTKFFPSVILTGSDYVKFAYIKSNGAVQIGVLNDLEKIKYLVESLKKFEIQMKIENPVDDKLYQKYFMQAIMKNAKTLEVVNENFFDEIHYFSEYRNYEYSRINYLKLVNSDVDYILIRDNTFIDIDEENRRTTSLNMKPNTAIKL